MSIFWRFAGSRPAIATTAAVLTLWIGAAFLVASPHGAPAASAAPASAPVVAPASAPLMQGVEATGIITTGTGTCFPDAVLLACDGSIAEQLKGPGGAGFFAPWYNKRVKLNGARLTCGGADSYLNVVTIEEDTGACPSGPLTATPPATLTPIPMTPTPIPPTVTPAIPGPDPAGNFAHGRPVFASTTAPGSAAENAVDGDLATSWASYPGSDPYLRAQNIQWIYVDLGAEVPTTEMQMIWNPVHYARGYGVYVWDDARRGWVLLGSTSYGDGDETWTVRGGGEITGRYFMLWLVNPWPLGGHYDLVEWSIKGTGSAPIGAVNEAAGKPLTALSEDPVYPASNATDGNTTTEWRPTAIPSWIHVDLGAEIPVERVILRWAAGLHATGYTLYAWSGGAWAPLHTERAGTGGDESISVAATTTRFVMVYVETGATTTVGLRELEVYRSGAAGVPGPAATATPPLPPPPPIPLVAGPALAVDGAPSIAAPFDLDFEKNVPNFIPDFDLSDAPHLYTLPYDPEAPSD